MGTHGVIAAQGGWGVHQRERPYVCESKCVMCLGGGWGLSQRWFRFIIYDNFTQQCSLVTPPPPSGNLKLAVLTTNTLPLFHERHTVLCQGRVGNGEKQSNGFYTSLLCAKTTLRLTTWSPIFHSDVCLCLAWRRCQRDGNVQRIVCSIRAPEPSWFLKDVIC